MECKCFVFEVWGWVFKGFESVVAKKKARANDENGLIAKILILVLILSGSCSRKVLAD